MTTELELKKLVVSTLADRYRAVVDEDLSKPHGLNELTLCPLAMDIAEVLNTKSPLWDLSTTSSIQDIVDLVKKSIY